jgi:hypothetical protein
MSSPTRSLLRLSILTCLLLPLGFTDTRAQPLDSYSRLGLSAAPDAFVSELTIQPGETFVLFVIAVGPQYGPLPFDVAEANWAIYATCCGQQAEIVDIQYADGMTHTGHPLGGVKSEMPICYEGDVISLAAITFRFFRDTPSTYIMAAGASGPLYDCAGEIHLLMDLAVDVTVAGSLTPVPKLSWGSLKAGYR